LFREPKRVRNNESNPTLAAKLKNQEPASQQKWGIHFYGGGQKRADAVLGQQSYLSG
jgi:hypothetical protein